MEPRDPIDRVTPTLRPAGPAQGSQRWRHLLFIHYEVEADLLRSLLPPGLQLDTFEGRAYVGVVPFTMQDVRPLRLLPPPPSSLGGDFHETNVRTYVHKDGEPGVWFFSLDAANRLAVWAARTFFHLPYRYARMDLRVASDEVTYQVRGAASLDLRYRIGEPLPKSEPGSLQFFLAERYLLFAHRKSDGALFRGQVHHAPYPLHAAQVLHLESGLLPSVGLCPRSDARPPDLYSPGVDVEIFPLRASG